MGCGNFHGVRIGGRTNTVQDGLRTQRLQKLVIVRRHGRRVFCYR